MKKYIIGVVLIILANSQVSAAISNNCTLLGATDGACSAAARYGSMMLIGAGCQLVILDCTDLAHPQRVGSFTIPGLIMSISIKNTIAFVAAVTRACA